MYVFIVQGIRYFAWQVVFAKLYKIKNGENRADTTSNTFTITTHHTIQMTFIKITKIKDSMNDFKCTIKITRR